MGQITGGNTNKKHREKVGNYHGPRLKSLKEKLKQLNCFSIDCLFSTFSK